MTSGCPDDRGHREAPCRLAAEPRTSVSGRFPFTPVSRTCRARPSPERLFHVDFRFRVRCRCRLSRLRRPQRGRPSRRLMPSPRSGTTAICRRDRDPQPGLLRRPIQRIELRQSTLEPGESATLETSSGCGPRRHPRDEPYCDGHGHRRCGDEVDDVHLHGRRG